MSHTQYFYTSAFLGVDITSDDPFTAMHERAAKFCPRNFDEVQREHPSEAVQDLTKYCFSSAYLVRGPSARPPHPPPPHAPLTLPAQLNVLRKGLALDFPARNVQVMHNKMGIDWALGAALHEVLALRPEELAAAALKTGVEGPAAAGAGVPAATGPVQVLVVDDGRFSSSSVYGIVLVTMIVSCWVAKMLPPQPLPSFLRYVKSNVM
jgi:hypothetical protein